MKVCYIAMAFPTRAETFACTDIRLLRQQGVSVCVHAMRRAGARDAALLAERGLEDLAVTRPTVASVGHALAFAVSRPWVTVCWIVAMLRATWRHPRFLGASLWLAPRVLDIARRLESERPDVVHLFWGHYPALVGALLPSILPHAVRSIFLGAYDLTYGFGPSRIVAREADVVVTHAHTNLAALAAQGVETSKVVVVHRGVDLSLFSPAHARVPGRVACAGRLCHDKRIADVLRACAAARAAVPSLSVVVMGDGPERPALEQLARTLGLDDVVRFTGHVRHESVRDELSRAEAFLHMSTEPTERLTNAVKEAMASGCACIVAESPGLQEMMTDGTDGRIVAPRDVATASAHLTDLLTHQAEATRMGQAAAARIRDGFDACRAMAIYRDRWSAALGARGPAVSRGGQDMVFAHGATSSKGGRS